MSAILWPLKFVLGTVHRLLTWCVRFLQLLRHPIVTLRPLGTAVFGRGRLPDRTTDPTSCAERFVRRVEDETGGSRGAGRPPVLPPFLVMGYTQALELAKEKFRVLMVVLISDEHDNTSAFLKGTLTHPELVAYLEEHQILVWGGNIADPEAWQVAETLDVTTFPSVTLMALQPVGPGRAGSGDKVIALARSQGAAEADETSRGPSSIIAPTSAPALLALLKSKVIVPSVVGHLSRLRREREDREAARLLRAEQDRAFEEAARKDTERILKVREMEKQKRIEADLAAKRESERKAAEEAEVARLEQMKQAEALTKQKRDQWLRSNLQKVLATPTEAGPLARIAFTLPNGQRLLRKFSGREPVLHLYIYAEASLAGVIDAVDHPGPSIDLTGFVYEPTFVLATTYPRTVILVSTAQERSRRLDELTAEGIWPGGSNLVLELT